MSEALRDFLVEVGFLHDASEQAKVEAAVKSTEDKITGTVSAGLQRRIDLERQAAEDRKRAAAEVGEALYKMVTTLSAKTEKAEVETGERAEKRDVEAGKRAAARVRDQLKQHEAAFLQVSRLATNLSGVLAGALASAPFGSFLMGVERTAVSMSKLAVQSKIVGTSVREIDKYRSAMKQASVDEGEAMGVLDSFSSKMKDNPEVYRQALERLHVRTLGPDGKPLSYAEMMENFGEHLSTLQPYQARIQAGAFGINNDAALNALMDTKTFRKNLNAEDDRMRALGLDPDKVAFQARRVEQEYDRMQDNLRLINLKVQSEFFLPMMEGFNKFADWLEAHPEETKKFEEGLVAFAGVVSVKVIPQLAKLAATLTGLTSLKPPPWLLAMLGIEGAKMLSENTLSNVESYRGESAAEFYTRAADPALADRIFGKSGEQQLHGPHHGLGVHAQPKDDRNLWQRTMPKALGGKDAPTSTAPQQGATGISVNTKLRDLDEAQRQQFLDVNHKLEGNPGALPDYNNPGNLMFSPYTKKKGANGAGLAGVAKFPTREMGEAAESDLLFGKNYRDLSIVDAMRKYTPRGDGANDPERKAARLAAGITPAKVSPDAAVAVGPNGEYPEWMDDRSKRELAGVNAELARDLLAAAKATGQRFKVAQGLRTQGEADANARNGRGVRNSQHLYGAAADIHLLDANGNVTYDRGAYQRFAGAFEEHSRAMGGNARWLGGVGGRWASDIVHFDQGLGYGQSHARNPYGSGGPTKEDIAEGNRMAYASPGNPFLAKPVDHPDDDRASRARAGDVSYGAKGHLSPLQATGARAGNPLSDLYKDGVLKVEVAKPIPGLQPIHDLRKLHDDIMRHAAAYPQGPKLDHRAMAASYSSSVRHGDHNERHGDTFHVHAKTAEEGMRAAERASARRGGKDGIRNGYSSQQ